MSSAIQAIETSIQAALMAVSGMTSAKAVLEFDDLYVPGNGKDQGGFMGKPDSFPGSLFCLSKDEITYPDKERIATVGQSRMRVVIPLYILIVATSDGSVATDARDLALKLNEDAILTLATTIPSGFPAYSAAFGPFDPKGYHEYPVDTKTHGILSRFIVQFQMGR